MTRGSDPGASRDSPARVRRSRGFDPVLFTFRVWLILFAVVGLQMGWVLRPFIGAPGHEFRFVADTQQNVFIGIGRAWSALTAGAGDNEGDLAR